MCGIGGRVDGVARSERAGGRAMEGRAGSRYHPDALSEGKFNNIRIVK